MSLAAENLFISQPALSRAIKTLEKQIGCQIFARTTKGVYLTKEGKTILPLVYEVIEKLEKIKMKGNVPQLSHNKNLFSPYSITITTIPTFGDNILPLLLEEFQKKFPNVNTSIRIIDTFNLRQIGDFKKNDIGIFINTNHYFDQEISELKLHFSPLYIENFSVIVNTSHPLAQNYETLIQDVLDYKLIFNFSGLSLESFFSKSLKKGTSLMVAFRSNDANAIKQLLLKHKDMVYVANNMIIKDILSECPELKILPIKNFKGQVFCVFDNFANPYVQIIEEFMRIMVSVRMKQTY